MSLEYESLEKFFNEFMLLFDNCIHYWKGYSPREGSVYITAAETLKKKVSAILSEANETIPDLAATALATLQQERVERRQKLYEKKRMESRPLTLSVEKVVPPTTTVPDRWNEQEYIQPPAISPTPPAPITRTHSRMMSGEASYAASK